MQSYVVLVKDEDGDITVVGKRNGNAFNTEERAEAVAEAIDGNAKAFAIEPHDVDEDAL